MIFERKSDTFERRPFDECSGRLDGKITNVLRRKQAFCLVPTIQLRLGEKQTVVNNYVSS